MGNQTVLFNSLNDVNISISEVSRVQMNLLLNTVKTLRNFGILLRKNQNQKIAIREDEEKQYIEIDFKEMELNKFYLIDYQSQKYAFRKSSENELETYDVV